MMSAHPHYYPPVLSVSCTLQAWGTPDAHCAAATCTSTLSASNTRSLSWACCWPLASPCQTQMRSESSDTPSWVSGDSVLNISAHRLSSSATLFHWPSPCYIVQVHPCGRRPFHGMCGHAPELAMHLSCLNADGSDRHFVRHREAIITVWWDSSFKVAGCQCLSNSPEYLIVHEHQPLILGHSGCFDIGRCYTA